MASVEIRDVRKSFGSTNVIHGVDIDIGDGEFVDPRRPLGLRQIDPAAHDRRAREHHLAAKSASATASSTMCRPKERDIAMVFQNYALYPHMTVKDNMAFSLKLRRRAEGGDRLPGRQGGRHPRPRRRCSSAIRASCRAASASASPWAARSCAIRRCSCSTSRCRTSTPSCASQMRAEIKALHQRLKTTTVYVTHDQIEAMTMADKIVVMHDGIVEQIGAPLELYDRPSNLFVAGFIGSPAMNFVKGRAQGGKFVAGFRRHAAAQRPCGDGRQGDHLWNAAGTSAHRSRRRAGRSRRHRTDGFGNPGRRYYGRAGDRLRAARTHRPQARAEDPAEARSEARAPVRCEHRKTPDVIKIPREKTQ